jgi:chromosome partitioning protein
LEHLGLSQSIIRDRIAFRKAARNGLAVPEMQPADPKAVFEIQEIYKATMAKKSKTLLKW